MRKNSLFTLLAALLVLVSIHAARAQTLLNQGTYNGHLYQLYEYSGTNYNSADDYWAYVNSYVLGLPTPSGYSTRYLAVIRSEAENNFIFSMINDNWGNNLLLGGYQPDPSKPAGEGWVWVNSELWDYTRWGPGEPNDAAGGERYLTIFGKSGAYPSYWNDMGNSFLYQVDGFFVEWEPVTAPPIPEPASLTLFGVGLAAVTALRRRR